MNQFPLPEIEIKLLSSLDKVFPDELPVYRPECMKLTALKGETLSFQAACLAHSDFIKTRADVKIHSPLKNYIQIRSVENVPAGRVCNPVTDDNYLKTVSGIYPDLLKELKNNTVDVYPGRWRSLWIDIELEKDAPSGTFPLDLILSREGQILGSASTSVTVYEAALPSQKLIHTEWVHTDCLADYYQVPVFSEDYWEILENFLREYTKRGCNMILTPLFTPPLDTAIGTERTTVQLIKVDLKENKFHFDFSLLKRWVDLCRRCGIQYFEMSHLFSQWGAKYPPKVIVSENGQEKKLFGWHTPDSKEYISFLQSFLPQLTAKLKEWEIAGVTYFHLSDEPSPDDLEGYRRAREAVGPLLKGFHTIDALSSYEFYRHGLIDKPIPGNNEIHEFLENGLTNMWTYYCVLQSCEVSNRFMAMPSLRNRIFGIQLYKYNIEGILHWGYNFYNSQFSLESLNPYQVTDAGGAFPSGDAFLVYPGENRHPEESIRIMVLQEALNDLRACQLLESLTSREYVMELIEEDLAEPLTFRKFPKSDMYLLQLRNRINREIAKRAGI